MSDHLDEVATALLEAFESRVPIAPVTQTWPALTLEDAYRVQQRVVDTWVRAGDMVRGHKIGLASAPMREQMGVNEPDFGHLTASMFRPEPFPVPAGDFLQPRVEPELAFVLGCELRGPGVTVADAARAVDLVLPALEIIDSRIRDWDLTIRDTVADNASSGGVVLGGATASLHEIDLPDLSCSLARNGRVVDHGVGAAVLGSPLHALVWLANTLGDLGVALQAEQIILTGSFTHSLPIAPGDIVTATFAGLGRVTLTVC